MSRESALHVKLVEMAASEVQRRHSYLYSLTVLVDLPQWGRDRPRLVGGYVPDVFAIDTPETCRIIGEAKTATDCETERSSRQFVAFLSHLALFPDGRFYLCVPLFYRARAAVLLDAAQLVARASSVKTMVIGAG